MSGSGGGGGLGTVFLIVGGVAFGPAVLVALMIGYAGYKTAEYNQGIIGGLFQPLIEFFLPHMTDETDALFPHMQDHVRKLKAAWDDIDDRDHEWHAAGHEERETLMKVAFCVAFYYSDRTFTDDEYEDFAWLFHNDSSLERVYYWLGHSFGVTFGPTEAASVEKALAIIAGDND